MQAVTGSGKTYLAIAAVRAIRERDPDSEVFVSVPSIALLDQWQVELEAARDIGVTGIVRHVDGAARGDGLTHIGTMHTLAKRISSLFDPRRPSMFVADECHRLGATSFRPVLTPPWQATLGLSATPRRDSDDHFERFVRPALGPIVYEYDYAAALRDGVISNFVLENYRIPSQRAPTRRDPLRGLSEAVLVVERHLPDRTLVFHESIDAANAINEVLNRRGIRADVYHSRRNEAARLRALSLFRSKQLDVLVTCRALDEGLNVPDVRVGVIAASTSSRRQRVQRMGRALRVSGSNDIATICTIYSTNAERARLEHEAAELRECREIRWFRLDG